MLSFQDGELLSKNEIFQEKSAASMQTPENVVTNSKSMRNITERAR